MTDLIFRNIKQSDREDLLAWRNDKTVREMSFNKAPVSIEEHNAWFDKAIIDPNKIFYIGEIRPHQKIGVARFDRIKNNSYEINVNLALQCRGQGLGKLLISEGCSRLMNEKGASEIIAQVKTENTASIKAFINAGFVKTEEKNNVIKMCFNLQGDQ